ncbi:MAG: TRAP transporter small permease subunit [Wenzhouxiangella sp.]
MHTALGGLARQLRELDVALTWLEKGLIVFLFSVLVLLGLALLPILAAQLAGERAVLGWIRLVLAWLLMLGSVRAVASAAHPALEPAWCRRVKLGAVIRLACGLIAGLVCLALAWAGWKLLVLDVSLGSSSWAGVPVWPALAALPVGFGLMTLRFTLQVMQALGQIGSTPSAKR